MKSRERRQNYKSLFTRAPRPNRAIKSKQQQQYRAREIRDASFAFESATSTFDNSQARETRRRKATSEGAHRPTKFNRSCGSYFCQWRSSAHICKPVSSSSSADSQQTQEDQTYCNTTIFCNVISCRRLHESNQASFARDSLYFSYFLTSQPKHLSR